MLKAHVIEITKACVAAFMKARNLMQGEEKIQKLQNGAKRPHCNFDFMNKIEVRSNTVYYQLGRLNNTRGQTF